MLRVSRVTLLVVAAARNTQSQHDRKPCRAPPRTLFLPSHLHLIIPVSRDDRVVGPAQDGALGGGRRAQVKEFCRTQKTRPRRKVDVRRHLRQTAGCTRQPSDRASSERSERRRVRGLSTNGSIATVERSGGRGFGVGGWGLRAQATGVGGSGSRVWSECAEDYRIGVPKEGELGGASLHHHQILDLLQARSRAGRRPALGASSEISSAKKSGVSGHPLAGPPLTNKSLIHKTRQQPQGQQDSGGTPVATHEPTPQQQSSTDECSVVLVGV